MGPMKAITIFLLLFCKIANCQAILYNDIIAISNQNVDKSAELLYSKDFGLTFTSNQIPYNKKFSLISENEYIDILFDNSNSAGVLIEICFSKKFNQEFKIIDNQFKLKLKKVRFFFSEKYNTYFTEYFKNNSYFYLGKGLCVDSSGFQFGTIIISKTRIE